MEPEEETDDDYADESFEAGDSSPEKRKRSPVKASRKHEEVHSTPLKTQPRGNELQQKSSVNKNHVIPSSVQELIRPCPFDYNCDDDDEEDDDEKTYSISLKLNPKKNKVKKTKGKKNTKVQQYATAEITTYARTEEENGRLVDELLEEYDLLPTKQTLRTTKQPIETQQPHGNKKSSKAATAARDVHLDDYSHSSNSFVENTGSILSRKGSIRKDPTTAAEQQKTKVPPSRNTNSFVMSTSIVTETSIATTTSMPKPTKRQQPPQPQPPVPPPSRELQRIAVLEEREQALIEAVEDLSNQNDELIKKLQQSMANELQLELR